MNASHQEDAPEIAQRILRWMRLATGQEELENAVGTWSSPPDTLTLHQIDPPAHALKGKPFPHVEAKAITFDAIRKAAALAPSFDVPVYAEMLMDAIEATYAADARKAILCSAIAVEVMASMRLRELFDNAKEKVPQDLRLVQRTQAGNIVMQRDPVFEELYRLSQRNFGLLLDAVPLYLVRRSMLQESERLYRELVRLHKTRNGLVHDSRPGEDRIPVDEEGMYRAIAAAIAAFDWFGAPGKYVVDSANQRLWKRKARRHLPRELPEPAR